MMGSSPVGRIDTWDQLAAAVGDVLDGAPEGRPLRLDLADVEVEVPGTTGHSRWRVRGHVAVSGGPDGSRA
ncbi:hypothetical protein [uncultured Nocardioides sp.]|uniref:hypothetical protein n=1 Tax=uncultured Nocardioides sp. TaxID=198441 RepID=UPI00261F7863|nr:hypothetical protein [uncultured Nocardioides sp.]